MWTCVTHTGYFVFCAILLTFLRCPAFSRAVLLLSVPLNAAAEVNQQPALDLAGLSMLLLTLSLGINTRWLTRQITLTLLFSLELYESRFICAGHWCVNRLWAWFQVRTPAAPLLALHGIVEPQKQSVSSFQSYPVSSTPQRYVCTVSFV